MVPVQCRVIESDGDNRLVLTLAQAKVNVVQKQVVELETAQNGPLQIGTADDSVAHERETAGPRAVASSQQQEFVIGCLDQLGGQAHILIAGNTGVGIVEDIRCHIQILDIGGRINAGLLSPGQDRVEIMDRYGAVLHSVL